MMLNQSKSYKLNKSLQTQKPKNLLISTYNYNQPNKIKNIRLSRPPSNVPKIKISEKILIQSNLKKKVMKITIFYFLHRQKK